AAPPAARTPLTILYATESGNSETLAAGVRKAAQRLGFAPKLLDMADVTPAQVAGGTALLAIASTWGEGDPPQRAEAFYAALLGPDAPRFDGQRFAVLALGDRAYANFCATGRAIDARLAALGGERVAPLVECDLDYAAPARAWTEQILAALAPAEAPEAGVIRVDFARAPAADDAPAAPLVAEAEITERVQLNSSRSSVETWHLELALDGTGLRYEPGDAIGIAPRNDPALVGDVLAATGLGGDPALAAALSERYDITTLTPTLLAAYAAQTGDAALQAIATDPARAADFLRGRQVIDLLQAAPAQLSATQLTGLLRPLPPRLYSVASAPEAVGEAAHLLVSAVRWNSFGRARAGVASVDLADRRRTGDRLSVHVKPNPHFRLPADADRPIVMIGPGTGVAPFRGFLQRREAEGARGRAWLFFGARQFTHDFLYQLEWQEWLAAGTLTRLDLAFSRDQPEKIYVQDRMWEARAELWRWLDDRAVVYVCGDAKAMARDVHATLLRVIAAGSGRDADGAAAWLRAAQQDGRYKRDVY
ncbi:MAG: flavodoxin domain-containing protein, partial [Rhodospirillales bacterium]|nr:flavodoxin domain-containing protein [Rhodospirillales bacterium]